RGGGGARAARAGLEGVRTTYPGTGAAQSATLAVAGAEMRLGQVDAAIRHFEEYLRQAPAGELLRVTALDGLGHAREAKQQLPEALDAYQRVSSEEASGVLGGVGGYHPARILAQPGKKAVA